MNLKALRDRVAELRSSIKDATKARAAIGLAAVTGKRKMDEDERASFATLTTEIADLEGSLEEAETALVAAEAANEAERVAALTTPDPEAVVAAVAAATGDPVRVEVTDHTQDPGYFGRQLQAVRNFTINGGWANISGSEQDLLRPMIPGMSASTGLNTDVGSEGGFLVNQQRAAGVLQRSYSTGELLSRVNRMPIGAGSNGMTFNAIDETSRADGSRFGGIVSGWLGQGNTLTAGKPKFRQIDLKLRKVGAFVYATDEQLADSIALEGWINQNLPRELTFRTEDSILNGTGANQPQGVLNSDAVLTITRATASRIQASDLRGMVNRMWAPLWSGAAFFVDQSTLGEFDLLEIPIGTGGTLDPSYKPKGSVAGQGFATYKGIPIIPTEHNAALGTTGDIALVNLGEYTLIDKGAIENAVSLHVAFLTDEAVFRFIYRVDGQLTWNSALTPKSGGDTLSSALVLS